MSKNLTVKQEKFCRAIAAGKAQSEAYRNAYNSKSMGSVTINVEASRLMKHPNIAQRIRELDAPVVEKIRMNRAEWYSRLGKASTYDVRKMFDTSGRLLPIKDIPENERLAIASFEIVEHYTGKGKNRRLVGRSSKFKFIDRLKALETLGKAKGFFNPDSEEENRIPRSMTVVFVEPKGTAEQTNLPKPRPQLEYHG